MTLFCRIGERKTEIQKHACGQQEVCLYMQSEDPENLLSPYPDVSGVVNVNGHLGGVDALHAADGDVLGFVLVLISRFPEGLCGSVCQAADHGGATGRLNVHHAGQILQTCHQAEILYGTCIQRSALIVVEHREKAAE